MVSFLEFEQWKTLAVGAGAVEAVADARGWRILDIARAGGSLRTLFEVK